MPTRFLSDVELAGLTGYPAEIAPEDLATYFRLDADDLRWMVEDHRGDANRLGLVLQMCTLLWLGFVPDDLKAAPAAAIERLAHQLGADAAGLADYGGWQDRTRTDHLREILARLHWRTAGPRELRQLDAFLLARALEHDSPTLLLRLACDQLRSAQILRPAIDPLARRVAAAREAASAETHRLLQPALTADRRERLDGLLAVDEEIGKTRLTWLGRGATQASPEAIKAELEKLRFLRSLEVDTIDLAALPPGRRRFLAQVGRHSTPQALSRSGPERRHPIVLATLAEAAIEVNDEVLQLFDQALGATANRARHRVEERIVARAQAAEERLALLDELLAVITDPAIPDGEVGGLLRRTIGMERLEAAQRESAEHRRPRDGGHLEELEASHTHLREFTPAVLAGIRLEAGREAAPLLEAVNILRDLNASGRRQVPDDAPVDFVPARWAGYLHDARAEGRSADFRHYWELCVLFALQAALRSGDIWAPGSRRYADPASYLIPMEAWPPLKANFCQLTGTPVSAAERLTGAEQELMAALAALEPVLASGAGPVRLGAEGSIIVSPLSAEDLPTEVAELRDRLAERMPRVELPSLLIEVDRLTHFSDALTHAGGATHRPAELRRNLYASILAQACNIGLTSMSDSSGISYDALAWTSEWYLREDTLKMANAAIVNEHHRLPLAGTWGGGTLSSSDGQRFPMRGRSVTARALSRYFVDEGVTSYTHTSDQHSQYGAQVIPSTVRDAPYVLDQILGNVTDLPIAEHAVDTSGQTFALFAAFDLLGLQFSPRIRDLPSLRLYRLGPAKELRAFPNAGRLLTQPIQRDLIADHWDDLLRLAASLKFGHSTASLLLAKLQAGSRQNALARALVELGRVIRTIFVLRYLAEPSYRRRIHRQLNKGESLHALRRDLFFAHVGHVRRRHLDEQTGQALCLTLTSNAVVHWNSVYLQLGIDQLRSEGHPVLDEAVAHLSPTLLEHVNPYGTYDFDVEHELARPGLRPLRAPSAPRA